VVVSSQKQIFTATVTGASTAVTWAVDGTAGGSAAVGTITPAGTYTPPATAGVHTILATSAADSTKSDSAIIAVTDLAGVFTYHNDLARDGVNAQELALNPGSGKYGHLRQTFLLSGGRRSLYAAAVGARSKRWRHSS